MDARRDLPSVSSLLETAGVKHLLEQYPRRVVIDALRESVKAARAAGEGRKTESQWLDTIAAAIRSSTRPSLRRVINATGVILHTNLGRAPLAATAIRAIEEVAGGFSNLEYDIATGQRGSRYSHCVGLLRQLTGAEDALVVNNCAAAMVLALNALAQRKEVSWSRSEAAFGFPTLWRAAAPSWSRSARPIGRMTTTTGARLRQSPERL